MKELSEMNDGEFIRFVRKRSRESEDEDNDKIFSLEELASGVKETEGTTLVWPAFLLYLLNEDGKALVIHKKLPNGMYLSQVETFDGAVYSSVYPRKWERLEKYADRVPRGLRVKNEQ